MLVILTWIESNQFFIFFIHSHSFVLNELRIKMHKFHSFWICLGYNDCYFYLVDLLLLFIIYYLIKIKLIYLKI